MKPLLLSFALFFTLQLSAQFSWMEIASSTNSSTKERHLGVCTGPSGEVFTAGISRFGNTDRPLIQSYDQNGILGFSHILSGTGIAYDAAYDRTTGRVAFAGTLNNSPLLQLVDPVSGTTIITAPINGTGLIKAIDVTATHYYAIGNYSGTLALGSLPPLTGGSAFIAQFDLNGTPLQTINITSTLAKGFDVKVDASGNVYFTLSTQSNIFFGPGSPGNYTHTSDEEFVLVQTDASFQAQYAVILRRTTFGVSEQTEIPLVLDEAASLVYVGTPWEPNATTPPVDGGIGSFDLLTGTFNAYTSLPGRTVRDLTLSCGELFAVGGTDAGFERTTCGLAGRNAWFERYGTTLTPTGLKSATNCSWAGAIAADDFGYLAVAGGFLTGLDLTWDTITTASLDRGGAIAARVDSGTECCVSSTERCLDFSGNNDLVFFGSSPLTGRTEFTVELWFNYEGGSTNAFRTLFSNNGLLTAGVRNNSLFVRANSGNNLNLAPIQPNRWHHLTVTYRSNTVTAYLDGLPVHQQTSTLSLGSDFLLGQFGFTSGAAFSWVGQLDEVSVFDYAKGPGEILDGLDCSRTGNDNGLLLYLPLDQGAPGQANPTVTTVTDQSPAGNNGLLQNFALTGQTGNWVCSSLILPECPPDTCGTQLPLNTFSRYREHLDVGSATTDKELDLAYGAFRLPGGDVVQIGVVAGSDNHNPLYIAKTDSKGDPIGNPDLYHPLLGNEAIQLLHDAPTPIRDAAGNLTGFLATGITEQPGFNQQRVLLRFDTSLNLLDSRFYQPILPGVREWFSDVIQDSNGDYIAIGRIDQFQYNAGFVMRITPGLVITDYQKLEDFTQDIYPDKIIEGAYTFGIGGFAVTSAYVLGGRTLSGELFVQGLDNNLVPSGNNAIQSVGTFGTGSFAQYMAGIDLLPDGRLAVTGTTKSGQVLLNLLYSGPTSLRTGSFSIDVDLGAEEAYSTELLVGNRLLIGGRAESDNSSQDSARALLMEVDLDSVSINWARTYGNANYPESVVTDIYADDRGILLSGYGITLTGTTAGGFFGDLNHFDSWLAATDTFGRVYDCDCYETTFATVSAATGNVGIGTLLEFLPVNPGQDDLAQDRKKASIVDFFCDQFQPVLPPACPGGEDQDRENLADNTTITVNGGLWTLANPSLPAGFELTVDWGDGTIETVPAGQLPLQHTYISASTYTVQTAYTVYAADGTICWQRNDDDTIISSSREENAGAVTLLAYPNPTDGIIHFRFGEELGSPSVTVFSMNGRAVRSASNLRNRELSLAGLSAGVYVVTLRFPGGEIARQRVILR